MIETPPSVLPHIIIEHTDVRSPEIRTTINVTATTEKKAFEQFKRVIKEIEKKK